MIPLRLGWGLREAVNAVPPAPAGVEPADHQLRARAGMARNIKPPGSEVELLQAEDRDGFL